MQKKILSSLVGILLSSLAYCAVATIKLTLDDIKKVSDKELCALSVNKSNLDETALDLIKSELYSRNIKCDSSNLSQALAGANDKDKQASKVIVSAKQDNKHGNVDKKNEVKQPLVKEHDESNDDFLEIEEITEEDVAIANSVNSPKCQKLLQDSAEYVKCNLEELNNFEPEEKE